MWGRGRSRGGRRSSFSRVMFLRRKPQMIMTRSTLFSHMITPPNEVGKMMLGKIIEVLKERFLRGDGDEIPLDEVVKMITDGDKVLGVRGDAKKILLETLIPACPRLSKKEDKIRYIPPFEIHSLEGVLDLIKRESGNGRGTLEDSVLSSTILGSTYISTLLEENKITAIIRPIDKKRILYFNQEDNKPKRKEYDEWMKKLFKDVNIGHLHLVDIERFLKLKEKDVGMKGVGVCKRIAGDVMRGGCKCEGCREKGERKRVREEIKKQKLEASGLDPSSLKKGQRGRKRKVRDNQHVAEDLKIYDENGEEEDDLKKDPDWNGGQAQGKRVIKAVRVKESEEDANKDDCQEDKLTSKVPEDSAASLTDVNASVEDQVPKPIENEEDQASSSHSHLDAILNKDDDDEPSGIKKVKGCSLSDSEEEEEEESKEPLPSHNPPQCRLALVTVPSRPVNQDKEEQEESGNLCLSEEESEDDEDNQKVDETPEGNDNEGPPHSLSDALSSEHAEEEQLLDHLDDNQNESTHLSGSSHDEILPHPDESDEINLSLEPDEEDDKKKGEEDEDEVQLISIKKKRKTSAAVDSGPSLPLFKKRKLGTFEILSRRNGRERAKEWLDKDTNKFKVPPEWMINRYFEEIDKKKKGGTGQDKNDDEDN